MIGKSIIHLGKSLRCSHAEKFGLISLLAASAGSDEQEPESVPEKRRSGGGKAIIAIVIVIAVVIAGAGAYLLMLHPSSVLNKKTTTTTSPSHSTITVWQDFSSTEFPAFLSARSSFMSLYPNITVDWVNQTTPSPSTLVSAALAGKAPNIIIGTSDFEGSTLFYHGLIVNLSSVVNGSFFSQYTSTARSDVTLNGSIYAFPLNINGVAMIYNKNLIPKAPVTTDQMIQMAKNITVISNGKYVTAGVAYGLGSDGGYRFVAWQAGFGGRLFASNGAPTINSTATVNALEFLNNLTTVNAVQPPALTGSEWQSLFETGHAGIIFDGPWDIAAYINALGVQNVGVAPMPIVSQTGLRPLPFLGSIATGVLTQKSSSASNSQMWASIKFGEYLASNATEIKLWNSAGDFPSVTSALSYVDSLNVGWATGYSNQFVNYSQHFINAPQMGYYWSPFGTYVSEFTSGKISAASAAADIQTAIVQSMTQNHVPPYVIVSSAVSSAAQSSEYASIFIAETGIET
jgi:arabinogalactan oligomer/maltooligosaccharide transport system substrate-binding protein